MGKVIERLTRSGIVHFGLVNEKLFEISIDPFAAISVYTFVTYLHHDHDGPNNSFGVGQN
jgi:hypothetical protein